MEKNLKKIGGCVVLYNPNMDVENNINTYLDILDCLAVVDNSDKINYNLVNELKKIKKIKYISMNGNKGIAAALNKGLNYLFENSFDIGLTMDQDSKFDEFNKKYMMSLVQKNIDKYAILSLNYNNNIKSKKEIKEVNYWITSGNFVNLKCFKAVNGFNEDLFIDYVDFDFCERLYKKGYKVAVFSDFNLIHKLGNPKIINAFFKQFILCTNHNYIRVYYKYRNLFYLYKNDKKFFRTLYLIEVYRNIPRIIFFDDNRIKKIKMLIKAKKDAKHNNLGKVKL